MYGPPAGAAFSFGLCFGPVPLLRQPAGPDHRKRTPVTASIPGAAEHCLSAPSSLYLYAFDEGARVCGSGAEIRGGAGTRERRVRPVGCHSNDATNRNIA